MFFTINVSRYRIVLGTTPNHRRLRFYIIEFKKKKSTLIFHFIAIIDVSRIFAICYSSSML